jgi:uncharacterized membrane protein YdjX (TVP38/TMEM64 family)
METYKKHNLKFALSTALLFVLSAVALFIMFKLNGYTPQVFKIFVCSLLIMLNTIYIVMYQLKKEIIHKLLFILIIATNVFAVGYLLLEYYGVIALFESVEQIKELILSTGNLGRFVFILIQFAQVCLVPIPAMITMLAGVAIYGPLEASLYSIISIIAGSLFSFFIWGRLAGHKLVSWMAGEETTEKYTSLLNEKGRYLLVLMFLFPFFPDDTLCMIAGTTKMKASYFIKAVLFVRPISIVAFCFLAGGNLIPYSGWGLVVWPILLAFVAYLFIYTYKNHGKIENYFANKSLQKKKKSLEKKASKLEKKVTNS